MPPVRWAKGDDWYIAFTQYGLAGGDDVVFTMGAAGTMELYWNLRAAPEPFARPERYRIRHEWSGLEWGAEASGRERYRAASTIWAS